MTPDPTRVERAIRSGQRRQALTIVVVTALLIAVVVLAYRSGVGARDRAELRQVVTEQAASISALREQVERCADLPAGAPGCDEPVAPPPAVPPGTTGPPAVIRESVPADVLEDVAHDAVRAALPDLTETAIAELDDLVDDAVAECVATEECIGPAFPVDELQQLVVDAVGGYCAGGGCEGPAGPEGPSGPPGEAGCCTEGEVAAIARREIAEYLVGRPVVCPRFPSDNGTTTVTCYVSVG